MTAWPGWGSILVQIKPLGSNGEMNMSKRILFGVAGAVVLLLAALLVPNHFMRSGTESHEAAVVSNLVILLSKWSAHHKTHGQYPTVEDLVLQGALPAKKPASSPGYNLMGYRLIDISGTNGGPYDRKVECGICAFPEDYLRSGKFTYIMDVSGIVYAKDNGGEPVTVWPDVGADGWLDIVR
jgi:hypothetical protein